VPQGVPLVLVGVGMDGCATLAAYVAEHGVERVSAVVLIEPSAPDTERVPVLDMGGVIIGAPSPTGTVKYGERRPLGPLEPLRAMANEARRAANCAKCHRGHPFAACDPAAHGLTLIIAGCPEAPPCEACGGSGEWTEYFTDANGDNDRLAPCPTCDGTGRMLPSDQVAAEIASGPVGEFIMRPPPPRYTYTWASGGLSIIVYEGRASLNEHGLKDALKMAMEERV